MEFPSSPSNRLQGRFLRRLSGLCAGVVPYYPLAWPWLTYGTPLPDLDEANWPLSRAAVGFVASVVPFGTFWFDRSLREEQARAAVKA